MQWVHASFLLVIFYGSILELSDWIVKNCFKRQTLLRMCHLDNGNLNKNETLQWTRNKNVQSTIIASFIDVGFSITTNSENAQAYCIQNGKVSRFKMILYWKAVWKLNSMPPPFAFCVCIGRCGCQSHAFCINYSFCLSTKCSLYVILKDEWEKREKWERVYEREWECGKGEKDRTRVDLARERKGGESYSQSTHAFIHPSIHPLTITNTHAHTYI